MNVKCEVIINFVDEQTFEQDYHVRWERRIIGLLSNKMYLLAAFAFGTHSSVLSSKQQLWWLRQSANENCSGFGDHTDNPPFSLTMASSGSVFDGCSDSCGWIAAFVSALAYGSYGVPIKETNHIPNAHPLVLQSYKSCTMFVTSWLVILLGVNPSFTPWGLVSGTLWVLGGTGGIYAVRTAGMAIAVGTWASVMIAVNFVWGILIFHEPVASVTSTLGAFALLALGLIGMSCYASPPSMEMASPSSSPPNSDGDASPMSSPPSSPNGSAHSSTSLLHGEEGYDLANTGGLPPSGPFRITQSGPRVKRIQRLSSSTDDDGVEILIASDGLMRIDSGQLFTSRSASFTMLQDHASTTAKDQNDANGDEDDYYDGNKPPPISSTSSAVILPQSTSDGKVHCCGFAIPLRTAGILGAVFNGLMTGSSLIPLHYAKQQGYGGANYMLSFAFGGLLANIGIWVLYAIWCMSVSTTTFPRHPGTTLSLSTRLWQTYANLPSWHVRDLGLPGCLAGILLTIAMFGSILSVTYLGQGIGNSVIQSKILISGLWGILWYKEITGYRTITSWFLSASVAVLGILWLSQERLSASSSSNSHRQLLLQLLGE